MPEAHSAYSAETRSRTKVSREPTGHRQRRSPGWSGLDPRHSSCLWFQMIGVGRTTYIGAGIAWGNDVPPAFAYAMDSKNGVTLLSVNGGHAIAAVQSVLGRIEEVGAVLSQRRQTVRVIETGETIPMKTPDQWVLDAVLQSGAPLSFQLRGGLPRGIRLLWEINGTEGDPRITAKAEQMPVINISPLRVEGGRRDEDGFRELEIPSFFTLASKTL